MEVKVQPLRHEGTKNEYEVRFCHELSKRELKYQFNVPIIKKRHQKNYIIAIVPCG